LTQRTPKAVRNRRTMSRRDPHRGEAHTAQRTQTIFLFKDNFWKILFLKILLLKILLSEDPVLKIFF